ncbi:MAG TPA: tetratricopeptide repeat protein, partial [Woeseiaceae bacterium]|nr:tetratricopeptide repeat protein [Woeseiaceae bacterium]
MSEDIDSRTGSAPLGPSDPAAPPDPVTPAERHTFRRKVIGWGAIAAVASAVLALAANLSEVFGWLKPDETRAIVEQTQSTIEDTDQKVNELVTLLRNQAAASGMSLDVEAEAAIRNAVEAIVISGDREKQAALAKMNDGDVAGAAAALEKLARSQGEAAATTGSTAAASWREAAALYDTVDVEKAAHAYEQAVAHQPHDAALQDDLGHALIRAGRNADARHRFESALAEEPEPAVRASALLGLGQLARQEGDYSQASMHFEEALAVATAGGARTERVYALRSLGVLRRAEGDPAAAAEYLDEALDLAEESGDDSLRALVLSAIGSNAAAIEDYDTATARLNEALDIYKAQNDLPKQAIVIGNLGAVALKRGDLDVAEPLLLESVELGEKLKWPTSIAYDMINLAMISGARENWAEADERLGRAQQIAEDTQLAELVPVIIFNRGEIAQSSGDLDAACRFWTEAAPMFVEMGSEH